MIQYVTVIVTRTPLDLGSRLNQARAHRNPCKDVTSCHSDHIPTSTEAGALKEADALKEDGAPKEGLCRRECL